MKRFFWHGLCLFLLFSPLLLSLPKAWALQWYLEAPYKVNPIGKDAVTAFYVPSVAYGFDCTTYVETVLAQYKQRQNGLSFQENLHKIRYIDAKVGFFSRAHFMEAHWIPNALQQNFIAEYPLQNSQKIHFHIPLRQWFLDNAFVEVKDDSYILQAQKQPHMVTAVLDYVPVQYINTQVLKSLPDFMVVFFLKKMSKKNLKKYGLEQSDTQIFITHMGILRHKKLYHASLRHKKVVMEDLLSYIRSIPEYVGVSLYAVKER